MGYASAVGLYWGCVDFSIGRNDSNNERLKQENEAQRRTDMTIEEVRRITELRNEAAAVMDECELAEAFRDEESSASNSYTSDAAAFVDRGWCIRRY